MRFAAILGVLFAMAGCANNPVTEMNKVAVRITLDETAGCSATVVGRHAILTAEHCLKGQHRLAIGDRAVEVTKVILDHHDHAIVLVKADFKDWAFLGDEPGQGDDVYVLGNPGDLRDMFRHGIVAGHKVLPDTGFDATMYDLNGFYGDSGSGIFNSQGQLVGVVSILYQQMDNGYMKVMGSFGLAFTEEQWQEAHG